MVVGGGGRGEWMEGGWVVVVVVLWLVSSQIKMVGTKTKLFEAPWNFIYERKLVYGHLICERKLVYEHSICGATAEFRNGSFYTTGLHIF